MPLSIGVNLRVTGHCNQGGRKYMEDMFSVAFQPTPDDKDLEYAFFGIFDGHGGGEAATFAKEHLMDIIVKQKNFWSDRDEDVLRAIRDGYMNTHYAMWRELDKWPRTASGLPSTAGTTASIAFIRKGKIYIGHVGDSGIILGYQADGDPQWRAKALTKDHKPESMPEMIRIQESGGKVVSKSGVPRVVWNRPRIGHKGPVRRSTHIDEIPFLAVARSLGDLWSYNSELDTFVVSPEPDVKVVAIDVKSHRCLIFGTDGLWNMLTPQAAVAIVQAADRHNEKHLIASQQTCNGQPDVQMWINPSKSLVDRALERWLSTRLRADNTSVVTLMLDPPGPSRSEVLLSQKERVLMHHGAHSPMTTILPESRPRPSSSPLTLGVPRPPPVTSFEPIDDKQPDSSNVLDEPKEVTPETGVAVPYPEEFTKEHGPAESEPQNTVPANTEEICSTESIQVAEISSSEILEDGTDSESKEPETVTAKETDDQGKPTEEPIAEQSSDSGSVQIVIQEVPREEAEASKPEDPDSADTVPENASCSSQELSPVNPSPSPGPISTPSSNPGLKQTAETNPCSENEAKSNVLTRHNRQSNAASTRSDGADSRMTRVTVTSRFRATRTTRLAAEEGGLRTAGTTNRSAGIGTKRRHSAISSQTTVNVGNNNNNGVAEEPGCTGQEPCTKRRTRSEDRPNPIDENDPANQTVEDPSSRLGWPQPEPGITRSGNVGPTVTGQERLSSPNTFQRRSLGKKATPVKAIRRSSINGSTRLQQLRGSFGLRDWDQGKNGRSTTGCNDRRINRTVSVLGTNDSTTVPQRWLRSDTMAATPVKTLRSRNIDIAGHTISSQIVHQYGVTKQSRLPVAKLKQQPSNAGSMQTSRVVRSTSGLATSKLKQTTGVPSGTVAAAACSNVNGSGPGGCTSSSTSSGIAKKVKSPYNPSARSLSTRSRIKRLGK